MPPDPPAADSGFNWFSLLGLVFIAVGFGLAWYARRTWKLASASQTWPKTTGKVLKSYQVYLGTAQLRAKPVSWPPVGPCQILDRLSFAGPHQWPVA
jgi:hypothetical protein